MTNNNDKNVKCPQCGADRTNDAIFCTSCGYKFEYNQNSDNDNHREKDNKVIIYAISVFMILFTICGSIFGYVAYKDYEQQKIQHQIDLEPYKSNLTFGDTNCTISAKYNEESQVIKINILTDEVIQEWQIEAIDIQPTVDFIIKSNGYADTLHSDNVVFIKDMNLQADFKITNSSLVDFVALKNKIKNAIPNGDLSISMNENLNLSSEKREQAKKNYFRARREAEEAEQRARFEAEQAERKLKEAEKQMEALNALGTMYMLGW